MECPASYRKQSCFLSVLATAGALFPMVKGLHFGKCPFQPASHAALSRRSTGPTSGER